ncbi:PREDICTED: uncharacterized protein LOC109582276 [Amphimedon queenslandica]|uniref:DUF4190 domain-containing protein n=1 Tax=Amphimedon queenslandica TaxID=400682 RepID=A0A1X7USD1_AMPQE|nr:PREDICTED: uncharacterized protein LOC109582276 [Amphimedon queenslandica]|eukprot:XP_019852493.1 PREDICTED: uncharacterized protein LOC109582276 [Amphimedon queenslandica]
MSGISTDNGSQDRTNSSCSSIERIEEEARRNETTNRSTPASTQNRREAPTRQESTLTRGTLDVTTRQASTIGRDTRDTSFNDPRGAVSADGEDQDHGNRRRQQRIIDPVDYSTPPPPYPGLHRTLSAQERAATRRHAPVHNVLQHSSTVPVIGRHSNPTRFRSTNPNLIPSIYHQEEDPNARYARQMTTSLCLLVTCVAICNIGSLFFTIPAVLCAWKAVQASMNDQYRKAEKRRNISILFFWIGVVQFVILLLLISLIVAIFLLIEDGVLSFNG